MISSNDYVLVLGLSQKPINLCKVFSLITLILGTAFDSVIMDYDTYINRYMVCYKMK